MKTTGSRVGLGAAMRSLTQTESMSQRSQSSINSSTLSGDSLSNAPSPKAIPMRIFKGTPILIFPHRILDRNCHFEAEPRNLSDRCRPTLHCDTLSRGQPPFKNPAPVLFRVSFAFFAVKLFFVNLRPLRQQVFTNSA